MRKLNRLPRSRSALTTKDDRLAWCGDGEGGETGPKRLEGGE